MQPGRLNEKAPEQQDAQDHNYGEYDDLDQAHD
jgi:hypothetical protein